MTREEAYNRIDAIIARHEIDDEYVTITSFLDYDALRMARKALEQEPCEDAISREDVINLKWQGEASEEFLEGYASAIEDARVLPSVKQDCDTCEVGNPCLYCKHEFEPQESEVSE